MTDIWKAIPKFPEYEAHSDGFVRRVTPAQGAIPGKIITPYRQPNGYLKVTLSTQGLRHKRYLHRLVLETFKGPPPVEGMDCAHNNGDRNDNRIDNLRWATRAENVADTDAHGTKARGEKNGHAVLTAQDVLKMRELRKTGTTQARLAAMFDVSRWTVADACSGKNWGWLK